MPSNALQISANLTNLGNRIEDEIIETGLDRGAQVIKNAKDRQVDETYKRPIPRGKNGKPKWERSGAFAQGQTIRSRRGVREIVTEGRAADYESRLADLPTGADGVNRTNKAAERAVEVAGEQAAQAVEQEIKNALRNL